MSPDEIQKFCIEQTKAYLSFLRQNQLGVQKTGVLRIERVSSEDPVRFKLVLRGRLHDPHSVSIRLEPPGRDYGPKEFAVVEYDEVTMSLVIHIRNPALELEEREPHEVKVVSDLTFLVQNVQTWLEKHGADVRLPANVGSDQVRFVPSRGLPLDDGQRDAIQSAMRNPLSYIWGPPGTGKTRHVLSEAVLRLVQAGKKVGIYAPTNIALEQAMEAVLLAAESRVERSKFLRVGWPSPKFAREFGDVCEAYGVQREIARLERQRKNYLVALNHRRGATVLDSAAKLQDGIEKVRQVLRRRHKYSELLGAAKKGSSDRG